MSRVLQAESRAAGPATDTESEWSVCGMKRALAEDAEEVERKELRKASESG
jgi:hypothetical protein